MKQLFTMAAVAAMVFTACSKEGESASGPMQIAIDPTIANPAVMPTAQRATRASDTDFEQNDAVGLTVVMSLSGQTYAANRKMTYNAAAQTFSAADFIWYEDANQPSALFAYYPWQEGDSAPAEFTVQADQSDDGYAKSDLIVAVKQNVYPSKSATAMTFKHKMTRIIVDVTNESGSEVTGIVIKGAVATGTLDPQTGEFASKAGVEPSAVKAHTATKDRMYYALLVPQNGVQLEVEVTTADNRVRSLTLGTTDLKSGENRRMPMNVQEKDITVSFSGPITGWEDGDQLVPDGGSTTDATLDYGGVKYKIVTLKDGRTWMAENLRYVPAGKTVESDFSKDGDGIWYPLKAQYDEDASKYVGVSTTEEAVIATNGYLYTFASVMGVDAITEENSATFEGKQGICPDGWHVPTLEEFNALIAAYPLPDNATQCSIADLEAAGFTCVLSGMRMKNTSVAAGSVSGACFEDHLSAGYLMSSTKNSYSVNATTQAITTQNKSLMFMHNAANQNGRVANASNLGGIPVRCIKDK